MSNTIVSSVFPRTSIINMTAPFFSFTWKGECLCLVSVTSYPGFFLLLKPLELGCHRREPGDEVDTK